MLIDLPSERARSLGQDCPKVEQIGLQEAGAETNRPQQASGIDDVVLFSGYYPSHNGGIELVCAELVEGLCRLGKRLRWVALEGDAFPVHSNCQLTPLQGSDAVYRRSGVPFPLFRLGSLLRIWSAIRQARAVFIADANFLVCVAAFAIAKLQRQPVLLIQHVGAPSTVSRFAARVMRLAELVAVRPMLRFADQVVYVSPVVADHFRGVQTRRPAKVIGHGVDADVFVPSAGPAEKAQDRAHFGFRCEAKIACFAGRRTASKGIGIFVRMAQLRPDWQFAVAGDGPIDPSAHNLPNLSTLGHVDRATLSRLYRASDVLVLPSRSESFSLVVREALAAGVKVLCGDQILQTDSAIAQYVLTRQVDLEAVDSTAEIFGRALDEPNTCTAEQARAFVLKNCSWQRILVSYAALLEELPHSARSAPLGLSR